MDNEEKLTLNDSLLDSDPFDIVENDSLEDIKARLEKRIDDIDEASAQFFNANYGQFFQFALLVAELEQPISRTIEPLIILRDRLQCVLHKLDNKLEEIDKKLEYLVTIANEKAIAQRLMKLAERRDSLALYSIVPAFADKNVTSFSSSTISTIRAPGSVTIKGLSHQTQTNSRGTDVISGQANVDSSPCPMLKSLQCELLERTNAELFYLLQKLNAGRHVDDLVQRITKSLVN